MVFFVGGEVFEELLLVFDSMLILSVISKGVSILIADFNCNSEVALRYMLSSSGLIILGSYVLRSFIFFDIGWNYCYCYIYYYYYLNFGTL